MFSSRNLFTFGSSANGASNNHPVAESPPEQSEEMKISIPKRRAAKTLEVGIQEYQRIQHQLQSKHEPVQVRVQSPH
jgi:hypothetical protein